MLAASVYALLAGFPILAEQGNRPSSAVPDVSRAAFIATMDAQFRTQDPNNDGKLTHAEIEASERAKTLAAAQATNRQIFAQLDTDHDGIVTAAEMRAGGIAPSGR
jgi:Ca2+-binding EF-hand superfamily protein